MYQISFGLVLEEYFHKLKKEKKSNKYILHHDPFMAMYTVLTKKPCDVS